MFIERALPADIAVRIDEAEQSGDWDALVAYLVEQGFDKPTAEGLIAAYRETK
jgi:hypothetical protein